MILTDNIFGQKKEEVIDGFLLEIGNASSFIATPGALASRLGINESIIGSFDINGSDITAIITENYNVGNAVFQGTGITYFRDYGGLIVAGWSMFQSCTQLQEVTALSLDNAGFSMFRYCSELLTVDFPKVTYLGHYLFQNCNKVKHLDFPELVQAYVTGSRSSGTFRNMAGLESINIPKCTILGTDSAYSSVFLSTGVQNFVINANTYLATNNNGGIDGDLQYAIDQKNAVVNFV